MRTNGVYFFPFFSFAAKLRKSVAIFHKYYKLLVKFNGISIHTDFIRSSMPIHHLSIEKAITYLKSELKGFEDSWSSFSSDCLGHGIICNRLLISWLERKRSNEL